MALTLHLSSYWWDGCQVPSLDRPLLTEGLFSPIETSESELPNLFFSRLSKFVPDRTERESSSDILRLLLLFASWTCKMGMQL